MIFWWGNCSRIRFVSWLEGVKLLLRFFYLRQSSRNCWTLSGYWGRRCWVRITKKSVFSISKYHFRIFCVGSGCVYASDFVTKSCHFYLKNCHHKLPLIEKKFDSRKNAESWLSLLRFESYFSSRRFDSGKRPILQNLQQYLHIQFCN